MNQNFKKHVFKDVISLMTGMWPTPLVKLSKISDNLFEVWAKLEFYNPFSHSIKDRPVWNMIKEAISAGVLKEKLYEATSGNVGIAMACLTNYLGKKFRAYLPKKATKVSEILIKMLGGEVIRTNFSTIDVSMVEYVQEEAKKDNASNLNQFMNDANYEAHLKYTAQELLEQIELIGIPPRAIIAGIGTSGHIAAISRKMKEKFGDDVKIIAVQPAKGSSIPGIKRVETKQKWLPLVKIDEIIDITKEESIAGVIELGRKEGLLIGLSSGAVYEAFKRVKEKYGKGLYVLVFPDDLFKYVDIIEKFIFS
ncbi:MAG: cysteine synthase family protein [Candidatus Njordarchaeales archaeon]